MLDRLFMLDAGGHPIYWGYPLEAIRHFNSLSSRVHADHVECAIVEMSILSSCLTL